MIWIFLGEIHQNIFLKSVKIVVKISLESLCERVMQIDVLTFFLSEFNFI